MRSSILNFPSVSGIYKITSPSGRVYIGDAVNLKQRCTCYLNPNRIKNQKAIYNSLVEHSVENHLIEIIEYCDSENLKERERYWQEFYNSVHGGLNCFFTNTKDKKKVLSDETKKIISEKATGKLNGFYGKKHTPEALKKISLNSSGKNNPNYGSKFKNEAYIQKQIDSNSKKPLKVTDTFTNEIFIFKNSKECAAKLNVNDGNIRNFKNKHKVLRRYFVEDFIEK
jgi:group I intron endonuclease